MLKLKIKIKKPPICDKITRKYNNILFMILYSLTKINSLIISYRILKETAKEQNNETGESSHNTVIQKENRGKYSCSYCKGTGHNARSCKLKSRSN